MLTERAVKNKNVRPSFVDIYWHISYYDKNSAIKSNLTRIFNVIKEKFAEPILWYEKHFWRSVYFENKTAKTCRLIKNNSHADVPSEILF